MDFRKRRICPMHRTDSAFPKIHGFSAAADNAIAMALSIAVKHRKH